MISSILAAIAGGALIGLAATWLLLSNGRIAGISGIFGGLLTGSNEDSHWKIAFLMGLAVGGLLLINLLPETLAAPEDRSSVLVATAGVLVGFGTRLGNGCTSGHGICGLSRFSRRSLVATLTFMTTGFATATLLGILGG